MKRIQSKQRRKLLLLAGAVASLSSRVVRAQLPPLPPPPPLPIVGSLLGLLERYEASIIPYPLNPYFVPQGSPGPGPGPVTGPSSGPGLQAGTQVSTLVLYDTTGQWGWLGEIYATMVANLASHFGAWTAMPVVSYTPGTLQQYSACIYIGSTYGEPLPAPFLADVTAGLTKVIWIYDNIWQLTASNPQFAATYGFLPYVFDTSAVSSVIYKSQSLKRYSANAAGIMSYTTVGAGTTVLAECQRADGTTFPWAVRSGNLTYIGEIPFAYMSEGDRYLAFCDLLFDLLAPTTATQHRALVRLEDIHPMSDPTALIQTAEWLFSNGIPFGFQITARYLDPNGYYTGGTPQDVPLHTQPLMVAAIRTMQLLGGVMIHHGYTHQYSNIANPYTAVTGDDCEFYRITSDPSNGALTYVGQLPTDTDSSWAQGRFDSYQTELEASTFAMPTLSTFPAYAASVPDYRAASQRFAARAERTLYFPGVLTQQAIDYTRPAGQFVPYSVLDLYRSKVLPDTLGGLDPTVYFNIPPRLPADIIADAQRTLVVRDGVASFFYNPEDPISYLQQTVQGLLDLGYQFVSPLDV
jgi:uncharacterized protein YdaL